jgi:hypothetical protein
LNSPQSTLLRARLRAALLAIVYAAEFTTELSRPPMIGPLLIIQLPDASNEGRVPLTFGPIDRFLLRFEGAEYMVRMIFDYIIVDATSLGAALGARST